MKDFFYIPNNLKLEEMLTANGDGLLASPFMLDKFYYIIDLLYLGFLLRDKDCEERPNGRYFRMNHRILEKVLTTKHAGLIKHKLIELGIIEENPKLYKNVNYLPGQFSTAYRFCEQYRDATFHRVPIFKEHFLNKIEAWRLKRNDLAIEGHPGKRLIRKSIEAVEFDIDAAIKFVEQQNYNTERRRARRIAVIEMFKNRSFNYSAYTIGRFFHIFTGCPRDLRQFFTFNGEPLFDIDMSDCQPALHATLYPLNSEEKQKFIDIVSSGRFKHFLNVRLEKPFDESNPDEMKKFKGECFGSIFYGSPFAKEDEMAKVFRENFPELAELIKLKKPYNNKRDLPVAMQNMEASVVIDKVAVQFAQNHKDEENICLISIHDCLITTAPYIEEIKYLMVKGFYELLGFNLSVKVKALRGEILQPCDFSNKLPNAGFLFKEPSKQSLQVEDEWVLG